MVFSRPGNVAAFADSYKGFPSAYYVAWEQKHYIAYFSIFLYNQSEKLWLFIYCVECESLMNKIKVVCTKKKVTPQKKMPVNPQKKDACKKALGYMAD